MTDDILSIEIRPGMFVRVHGIPHDLTRAEADRLAKVMQAFAQPADPTDHHAESSLTPAPLVGL